MFLFPRRVIDPTNLQGADDEILYQLLKQRSKNINVLLPEVAYKIRLPNSLLSTTIYLTHQIVHRKNDKNQSRYSVVSNEDPIGRGGYGAVHKLEGTLAPQDKKKMIFKHRKKRVIKIQDHLRRKRINGEDEHRNPIEGAKKDEKYSQAAPHLSAKKMTYSTGYSFLVMNQFKDADLFSIINKDITGEEKLSTEKRLLISLNLIRALQEVHDHQLIHRDLKPENIIVNLETCEVRIIDFGLARNITEPPDGLNCGTPQYASIDCFKHGYWLDQKSEVYSLGLILAALWGVKVRGVFHEFPEELIVSLSQGFERATWNTFFAEMDDQLSAVNKQIIFNAVKGLATVNRENRWELEDAFRAFSGAALNQKFENSPEILNFSQVQSAHELALNAARDIRSITNNPSLLKYTISEAVKEISSSGIPLQVFLDTLQIKALQGSNTKEEVNSRIESIFQNFDANIRAIQRLHENLRSKLKVFDDLELCWPSLTPRFNKIRKDLMKINTLVDATLNKRENVHLTFDSIAKLNNTYFKEALNIQAALDQLEAPMRTVQSYRNIGNDLHHVGNDDPLADSKNKIFDVVSRYIYTTFTHANYIKGDRAASSRRCKDMEDIIDLVKDATDSNKLNKKLTNRLSQIQTGFFGRSKLRDEIKKVITAKNKR